MQLRQLQDDLPVAWGIWGGGLEMGVDAFVWHMHFEWLLYGI